MVAKYRNRFFAKDKRPLSFLLTLVFAVILMFADYRYHSLTVVRRTFALLIFPLQYIVNYPVSIIGWMQSAARAKKDLIDENIKLHYQQTLLEAQLQNLLVIKEENLQLSKLLQTAVKANVRSMAAQILAVDLGGARQLIIIDKGTRDEVYIGQPVLDAKGVVGQVVDVGYMTSTVLLISDVKSAVPVRNNRTGEYGIVTGTNNISKLQMLNLPRTSAIAKDDLLVTSGLGRLYPEGYPVGHVAEINRLAGDAFIKVGVKPMALLNRNRIILLVWPDQNHASLTLQINERLRAIKAKG